MTLAAIIVGAVWAAALLLADLVLTIRLCMTKHSECDPSTRLP